MKQKLFSFLILLLPLLDGISTYLANDGTLNKSNEMNLLVQQFGFGFMGLGILFLVEITILYILFYYYIKNIPNESYKYKLLEKSKSSLKSLNFKRNIPVFISILLSSHFIAVLNNLFIFFYKKHIYLSIVKPYIQFVHIQGRIYMVYILIVFFACIITYIFSINNNQNDKI